MNLGLLKKSSLFGLYTVLVGSIVGAVLAMFFKVQLPEICSTWNKYYLMEMSLFFTGVVVFFSFNLVYANAKKYIKVLR